MSATQTAEVKGYNKVLAEKVQSNKEISDSFEIDEKGTVIVTPEHKAAFDDNMKSIRELRSLIADLTEMDSAEKAYNAPERDDSVGFTANGELSGRKTLGELFLDSDEFKELQNGRNGYSTRTPFEIKAANIGSMWRMSQKDLFSGTFSSPSDYPSGAIQSDGMIDRNRRIQRVRDLFPVQNTTAAVIEYFRVGGFTNAASVVPQRSSGSFGLKPQSALSFVGQQAPVRTIAHWEAAHRNVLADEPQLRGIVDNELLYGLRLAEDAQILSGTGTGEDLEGILNTPGIQSYSWSQGATTPVVDTKADALRRAATLAFLAYYQPTGVVLHPNDWEDIELTKSTTGEYLLAVSIAIGGEPKVWNMPVVDSPAIEEGRALLGAFGLGAQLYDREEANIRIAEQHSDFFVRNAVVILAEERIALAVKRPESFVEVLFDAHP